MQTALYRDKEGQVVYQFPFILLVDPIMNEGRIYPDAEAVDLAFLDDELLDEATPDTILPMLAARGYRIYFLRSDADMEDEILPYFAIADGQLQEIMAALWLQRDFEFPGAQHVAWESTTTRLYTDGEHVLCEGHHVTLNLPEDDPARPALEAHVTQMLEEYAHEVARELRTTLKHVKARVR